MAVEYSPTSSYPQPTLYSTAILLQPSHLVLHWILLAVIASLEREAEERGEARAVGLSRVVQRYK